MSANLWHLASQMFCALYRSSDNITEKTLLEGETFEAAIRNVNEGLASAYKRCPVAQRNLIRAMLGECAPFTLRKYIAEKKISTDLPIIEKLGIDSHLLLEWCKRYPPEEIEKQLRYSYSPEGFSKALLEGKTKVVMPQEDIDRMLSESVEVVTKEKIEQAVTAIDSQLKSYDENKRESEILRNAHKSVLQGIKDKSEKDQKEKREGLVAEITTIEDTISTEQLKLTKKQGELQSAINKIMREEVETTTALTTRLSEITKVMKSMDAIKGSLFYHVEFYRAIHSNKDAIEEAVKKYSVIATSRILEDPTSYLTDMRLGSLIDDIFQKWKPAAAAMNIQQKKKNKDQKKEQGGQPEPQQDNEQQDNSAFALLKRMKDVIAETMGNWQSAKEKENWRNLLSRKISFLDRNTASVLLFFPYKIEETMAGLIQINSHMSKVRDAVTKLSSNQAPEIYKPENWRVSEKEVAVLEADAKAIPALYAQVNFKLSPFIPHTNPIDVQEIPGAADIAEELKTSVGGFTPIQVFKTVVENCASSFVERLFEFVNISLLLRLTASTTSRINELFVQPSLLIPSAKFGLVGKKFALPEESLSTVKLAASNGVSILSDSLTMPTWELKKQVLGKLREDASLPTEKKITEAEDDPDYIGAGSSGTISTDLDNEANEKILDIFRQLSDKKLIAKSSSDDLIVNTDTLTKIIRHYTDLGTVEAKEEDSVIKPLLDILPEIDKARNSIKIAAAEYESQYGENTDVDAIIKTLASAFMSGNNDPLTMVNSALRDIYNKKGLPETNLFKMIAGAVQLCVEMGSVTGQISAEDIASEIKKEKTDAYAAIKEKLDQVQNLSNQYRIKGHSDTRGKDGRTITGLKELSVLDKLDDSLKKGKDIDIKQAEKELEAAEKALVDADTENHATVKSAGTALQNATNNLAKSSKTVKDAAKSPEKDKSSNIQAIAASISSNAAKASEYAAVIADSPVSTPQQKLVAKEVNDTSSSISKLIQELKALEDAYANIQKSILIVSASGKSKLASKIQEIERIVSEAKIQLSYLSVIKIGIDDILSFDNYLSSFVEEYDAEIVHRHSQNWPALRGKLLASENTLVSATKKLQSLIVGTDFHNVLSSVVKKIEKLKIEEGYREDAGKIGNDVTEQIHSILKMLPELERDVTEIEKILPDLYAMNTPVDPVWIQKMENLKKLLAAISSKISQSLSLIAKYTQEVIKLLTEAEKLLDEADEIYTASADVASKRDMELIKTKRDKILAELDKTSTSFDASSREFPKIEIPVKKPVTPTEKLGWIDRTYGRAIAFLQARKAERERKNRELRQKFANILNGIPSSPVSPLWNPTRWWPMGSEYSKTKLAKQFAKKIGIDAVKEPTKWKPMVIRTVFTAARESLKEYQPKQYLHRGSVPERPTDLTDIPGRRPEKIQSGTKLEGIFYDPTPQNPQWCIRKQVMSAPVAIPGGHAEQAFIYYTIPLDEYVGLSKQTATQAQTMAATSGGEFERLLSEF